MYKSHFLSTTLFEIGLAMTEAGRICAATLDQTFLFPPEGSPVGYPVDGAEILFLNDAGCEVSAGEVGEIAVKGSCLALGYWKRPDLTRSSFRADGQGAAEHIYLTGDLGRMLPDGFVVHLGRKDLMVKIRGYRVDFSEAERALLEHPSIKDAGVRAWDREDGEKYLAAYVVALPGSQLNVSAIRKFLANRLPSYMMPSVFMFLESLPMTNRKLDRTGLPRPDRGRPNLDQPYIASSNEIETKLSLIWEALLDIRPVGIQDNFFDLGGHSLIAARVVSRVIESFQLELPVQTLFECPTIAAMALIIAQHKARPASTEALVKMLGEIEAMTDEEAEAQLATDVVRS